MLHLSVGLQAVLKDVIECPQFGSYIVLSNWWSAIMLLKTMYDVYELERHGKPSPENSWKFLIQCGLGLIFV